MGGNGRRKASDASPASPASPKDADLSPESVESIHIPLLESANAAASTGGDDEAEEKNASQVCSASEGDGQTSPGKQQGYSAGMHSKAAEAESEKIHVDIARLLRIGPVVEEASRVKKAQEASGNKGKFARHAHETLQIIATGGYRPEAGGEWVDLRHAIQAAVASSEYYAAGSWNPRSLASASLETAIEVRCCTCLAAARELASLEDNATAPGVLNFASARNPGGGFCTGASAQEESIARSSALYPCLKSTLKHFLFQADLLQVVSTLTT